MRQRANFPLIAVFFVYLVGLAALAALLEGPSLPLGALLAFAALLSPGFTAAWSQGNTTPAGWLILMLLSFALGLLFLALKVFWVGFGLGGDVSLFAVLNVVGWAFGRRGRSEGLPDSGARRWRTGPRLYAGPVMPWDVWVPLAGLAAVVSIAVLLPFGSIGADVTGQGFAFRRYFDHDFLVHLSVVNELGRADFPPQNPYFGGETLHYYWLYFLYPAWAAQLGGNTCRHQNVLVFCNYSVVLLFVTFFYTFLLSLTANAWKAAGVVLTALFAGSFEGAHVLLRIARGMHPLSVNDYNIDGVTRHLFAEPQIDTLLRALLYTPQHLVALSVMLGVALVLRRREERPGAGWVFALLVPLPALSGFVAAIVLGWLLSMCFLDFSSGEEDRRWTKNLLAVVSGGVIGITICFWTGMFGSGEGFVTVAPRQKTWQYFFTLLWLNFGALGALGLIGASLSFWRRTRLSNVLLVLSGLVFALTWHSSRNQLYDTQSLSGALLYGASLVSASAGLLVSVRERHRGGRDYLCLALIALVAIFSGFIPGYGNEFGLRGGFVLAICCAAFVGMLWRHSETGSARSRWLLAALALVLVTFALPTSAIDLRSLTNLSDPRFTTYVSPREQEAYQWIRENLPADAIIQGLPNRKQDGRRLIGNFLNALGERRMAAGRTYYAGQFQIGQSAAAKRVERAESVFHALPALRRLEAIRDLGIGYLLIGRYERAASDWEFFFSRPALFAPVFDNREVTVFRVERGELLRRSGPLQALPSGEGTSP